MSQRYFCPAEYTTKTKRKTNQKTNPNFRFWLSVYSAGQKYRWLVFLVVPVVTNNQSAHLKFGCDVKPNNYWQTRPKQKRTAAWRLWKQINSNCMFFQVLVSAEDGLSEFASIYHEAALVLFARLQPGDEYYAHDLMSTVLYNTRFYPWVSEFCCCCCCLHWVNHVCLHWITSCRYLLSLQSLLVHFLLRIFLSFVFSIFEK